jgi:hypothetical protein
MINTDLNARPSRVLVPLTCGRDHFDFIFTKLAPECNDATLVISVCKRCGGLILICGQFSNIMASLMLAILISGSNKDFIAKQVRILCVVLRSLFSWRPLSL